MQEYQIDFVRKIAESLASVLIAVNTQQQTQALLHQLQENTEIKQSQEEEMRQNMEELVATQEEMECKEREYLQRIAKLETN